MAARPAAALALVALLAGCSGPATAPVGDAAGPAESLPSAALHLPEWKVGDHWTYSFGGVATTYVVTSDAGADWIVDTDSEERAFADAREDVSRLGPQRKSDLAGSQGEDRVEFFRWPLADGMSWTTRWDQRDVTVTARLEQGLARLEARAANGTLAYRYTYDPKAGWFGELRAYAPDGQELVALTLTEAGHGWTGKAVRWKLTGIHSAQGAEPASNVQPVAAGADATDVWLGYRLSCPAGGGYSIALKPAGAGAATEGHLGSGRCEADVRAEAVVPAPLDAPWVLAYSWGGGAIAYEVELLQRTRVEVPVG